MTDAAYLVHLHAPFGHAQHYLGWSADPPWRLRHPGRWSACGPARPCAYAARQHDATPFTTVPA